MLATYALYPHRTIPLAYEAREDLRFLQRAQDEGEYRFLGVEYDGKAEYPKRWRVVLQLPEPRLPQLVFAASAERALKLARAAVEKRIAARTQRAESPHLICAGATP